MTNWIGQHMASRQARRIPLLGDLVALPLLGEQRCHPIQDIHWTGGLEHDFELRER